MVRGVEKTGKIGRRGKADNTATKPRKRRHSGVATFKVLLQNPSKNNKPPDLCFDVAAIQLHTIQLNTGTSRIALRCSQESWNLPLTNVLDTIFTLEGACYVFHCTQVQHDRVCLLIDCCPRRHKTLTPAQYFT